MLTHPTRDLLRINFGTKDKPREDGVHPDECDKLAAEMAEVVTRYFIKRMKREWRVKFTDKYIAGLTQAFDGVLRDEVKEAVRENDLLAEDMWS